MFSIYFADISLIQCSIVWTWASTSLAKTLEARQCRCEAGVCDRRQSVCKWDSELTSSSLLLNVDTLYSTRKFGGGQSFLCYAHCTARKRLTNFLVRRSLIVCGGRVGRILPCLCQTIQTRSLYYCPQQKAWISIDSLQIDRIVTLTHSNHRRTAVAIVSRNKITVPQ